MAMLSVVSTRELVLSILVIPGAVNGRLQASIKRVSASLPDRDVYFRSALRCDKKCIQGVHQQLPGQGETDRHRHVPGTSSIPI